MVSAARKYLPINPLLPALQFSTNDTIDKFYERGERNSENLRLVSTQSLKQAGTRSRYISDYTETMCEMRVKLTYLFSSAAIIDPHLYQRTWPSSNILETATLS